MRCYGRMGVFDAGRVERERSDSETSDIVYNGADSFGGRRRIG